MDYQTLYKITISSDSLKIFLSPKTYSPYSWNKNKKEQLSTLLVYFRAQQKFSIFLNAVLDV